MEEVSGLYRKGTDNHKNEGTTTACGQQQAENGPAISQRPANREQSRNASGIASLALTDSSNSCLRHDKFLVLMSHGEKSAHRMLNRVLECSGEGGGLSE